MKLNTRGRGSITLQKQLRTSERQPETTTSTPERARGRPKARNQPQELPTLPPYPD